MSLLPDDIARLATRKTGTIETVQAVSGGCINNGACITGSEGKFFVKWNSAGRFPGMFEAEASGLRLLAEQHCIRIPNVTGVLAGTSVNGILLEYVETRRTTAMAEEKLGHQLAQLHRNSSKSFGLDHDNYMGSLPQKNARRDDLVAFFIECRLQPQVQLARESGRMEQQAVRSTESLYRRLPDLLVKESPALIHGDLWNGNFLVDTDENPVLIDPAVSYGHREMDMAMTRLFGGFPETFYEAYQESFPMAPGYPDRLDLFNLYPLLVHVNLFGGGYLGQAMQIVRRFT